MTKDRLKQVEQRLRSLEDDRSDLLLDAVGGVGGEAATPTAVPTTSSCTKATALNLGTVDLPAGAPAVLIDDQHDEDRTDRWDRFQQRVSGLEVVDAQLWGHDDEPATGTVVKGTVNGQPRVSSGPFRGGYEPDDLVLIFGMNHTGQTNINAFEVRDSNNTSNTFTSWEPRQQTDANGIPSNASANNNIRAFWFDEAPEGADQLYYPLSANNGTTTLMYVVLRNVWRDKDRNLGVSDPGADFYLFEGTEQSQAFQQVNAELGFLENEGRIDIPTTEELIDGVVFHGGASKVAVAASSVSAGVEGFLANESQAQFGVTDRFYYQTAGISRNLAGGSYVPEVTPFATGFGTAGGIPQLARAYVAIAMRTLTAPEAPPLPDSPCNALIVREKQPHTFLATDDSPGRRSARQRLARESKRRIVIAAKPVARGAEGEFVRNGTFAAWCYVRDPEHCWATVAPSNAIRRELYDSATLATVTGEVGKLGEYWRFGEPPTGLDPRTQYGRWSPLILVSSAEPSQVEILRQYDKPYEAVTTSVDQVVTVAITKSANTGGGYGLDFDAISLATGFSFDPRLRLQGTSTAGGQDLFVGVIDLAADYPGLNPLPYGDGTPNQTFASASGRMKGTLRDGRTLIITYQPFAFDAVANGPVAETITIPQPIASEVLPDSDASRFAVAHPFLYADPSLAGVTGDYADWPEVLPEPFEPFPTGTVFETVPEKGYDPYIRRVPGSVETERTHDNATGIKRLWLRLSEATPTPTAIPCCD